VNVSWQRMRWVAVIPFLLLTGCQSNGSAKDRASAPGEEKVYRNINDVVQRRLPIRSVSKGWDGNKITWPTESNLYYTVMYYDGAKRRMPQWKILPSGYNLKGTGQEVVVEDKPPRGMNREYRIEVHVQPLGQMQQAER
jgi:hypothetical protein